MHFENSSILIKDTTKEERIQIIKSWIPIDEVGEENSVDLWDMYHDYINGEKEIAEINASFRTNYIGEFE